MNIIVPAAYFLFEFVIVALAHKFVVTDKFAGIKSIDDKKDEEKKGDNKIEKSCAGNSDATENTAVENLLDKKSLDKSTSDEVLASKSDRSKGATEDEQPCDISDLLSQIDDGNGKKDKYTKDGFLIVALRKLKGLLYDNKYSLLISAFLFSIIAAVCGGFVAYYTEIIASAIPVNTLMIYIRLFIVFAGLSVAFLTDVRYHLIFNKILLIMLGIRIVLFLPEYLMAPDDFLSTLTTCCVGAVITFVIMVILSLLSKGALGMGDVKLLAVISFTADIYCSVNILLYSSIACMLFFIILLLMKSKKAKEKIPFAPFIFVGLIITLLLGAF